MNHKLIFRDDKSDKFWNIETSGNFFTVTYGKTGTAGTSQTKTFETEETCIKEARKLLSEKLKKGYIEGNDRTEKLTSNNDKKHKSNQQEADKIVISKSEEKTKSAPQKVIEESENEIKQSSQTSANKKENSQTQEQNSNPLPSENSTELNKISLYYQGDGSDKVYHVNIDPEGDGYVVHFAFGRRGSSLQTGTKTSKPVSYEAAQKIMRQLVNSKMAKGYTEIESGAPYLHSTKEERVSGVHCQLLNPIDEEELSTYVEDDQYGAQEKLDGNRMMIRKIGDNVEGINRKGLIIAISQILHDHSLSFSEDFILDGEVIGDVFFPFDIFSKDGKDIQHLPYQERYAILESILKDQDEIFHIVKLVKSTKGKKVLLEELREKQKEGIVFKDLNAPYKAGRPSSKGSQIKFKFYETATVSVETVNLKRSVSMRLYNGNEWVSVGNVTIPVNFAIPKENDIIEVRYLYAYKGGSLYQPTYLGVRTDADENDCDLKQLKYKNT
ncbi:WGR domain-containing protein [Leptospira interrogans]|uniref:ATP-dependent DNA ligase n=1 Tax=Leptospira interrogans serovar Hardjo str. Norma TaxID=1279460 RepID=A0A0M5LFN7_LEPIR|nr:WGR domain-containing protein [Leptospira interrogans]ALE40623.1 ATP-dependent DNA ligase [Leptospira interrogans serovar Hardjo str. Norma]ALN99677.1 ATP-dependent DNA ligase [Leptospira interrogans serovar Hardjo-prajitno]EKO96528.1 ATP-dependent DNA ligase-like domain protein [Leptospira interrogans str. Brem 329]MCD1165330.1 WGR domain-containing protein [Leptospira interrogans]MCH1887351.1 WGR domain-containing protein [Leptospira interrogans]